MNNYKFTELNTFMNEADRFIRTTRENKTTLAKPLAKDNRNDIDRAYNNILVAHGNCRVAAQKCVDKMDTIIARLEQDAFKSVSEDFNFLKLPVVLTTFQLDELAARNECDALMMQALNQYKEKHYPEYMQKYETLPEQLKKYKEQFEGIAREALLTYTRGADALQAAEALEFGFIPNLDNLDEIDKAFAAANRK